MRSLVLLGLKHRVERLRFSDADALDSLAPISLLGGSGEKSGVSFNGLLEASGEVCAGIEWLVSLKPSLPSDALALESSPILSVIPTFLRSNRWERPVCLVVTIMIMLMCYERPKRETGANWRNKTIRKKLGEGLFQNISSQPPFLVARYELLRLASRSASALWRRGQLSVCPCGPHSNFFGSLQINLQGSVKPPHSSVDSIILGTYTSNFIPFLIDCQRAKNIIATPSAPAGAE